MPIFVFVCSSKMVKNGKTKAGTQRYRCLDCGSSQSRSELRRIKAVFGGATCIRKPL